MSDMGHDIINKIPQNPLIIFNNSIHDQLFLKTKF